MTLMDVTDTVNQPRKHSQSSVTKHDKRKRSSKSSTSKKRKQSEADEIDQDEIAGDLRGNFPIIRDHFDVTAIVGEGTFSKVYLAQLKAYPEEIVAVKHIVPTSSPTRVKNELACLQQLGGKHNIIGVKTTLRNNDHVAFLLPYFKHDKFQTFFRRLTTNEIKDYMRNLFAALKHVHSYDIIHRDVKPSNFLHSRETNEYSLVDFGLAMQIPGTCGILSDEKEINGSKGNSAASSRDALRRHQSSQNDATKNAVKSSIARGDKHAGKSTRQRTDSRAKSEVLCKYEMQPGHSSKSVCNICCKKPGQIAPRAGTPGFRSPEVLMKLPSQTAAVDIWSAGIILLSFLSGRYPFFKAKDDLSALAQIISVFGSKEAEEAGKLMGKDLICSPSVTSYELKELCEKLRQKTCRCHEGCRNKRKYSSRDGTSKRARIESYEEKGRNELTSGRYNVAAEQKRSSESSNYIDRSKKFNERDSRSATSRKSPKKRSGLRRSDKAETLTSPIGTDQVMRLSSNLEESARLSEHGAEKVNSAARCSRSSSSSVITGDCYCIPDEAYDLLSKCLKLDPAQRITAADALNHHFLVS